jgi:hypothetical protein
MTPKNRTDFAAFTPFPSPAHPCEACSRTTHGERLCGVCWSALPQDVKDVCYDAVGPDKAAFDKAMDAAVAVAKATDRRLWAK